MGKHERARSHVHASCSSFLLDERYRGRMRGLFHILNYHQWRYIKRRLHHWRHGAERHLAGDPGSSAAAGRSEGLSKLSNDCEESSSKYHRKRDSGKGASKNSMRGRIKSLIQDDKFRHKGQHHRTLTAPAPLQSIQANTDSLLMTPTNDVSPTTLRQHRSRKNSALREGEAFMMDGHIDQNRIDHHEKQPITHSRKDEENLEQHSDLRSSDYQSTNSINSLDVVEGINKELLLKFIHDAGAFSAHQRKQLSKRGRLQRLGTFPFPGLHIGNVSEESPPAENNGEQLGSQKRNLQDGHQDMSRAEVESLGDVHREMNLEAEADASHHNTDGAVYASVVVGNDRTHGKNQAVSKHFKALKQKIKHVMKVNRKEKNRIAMDGILHRIPGDKEFSGELMEEMIQKWKEATISHVGSTVQDGNKHYATSGPPGMARKPSLEASLHKYAQLFESSFGTEAKYQDSSTCPASSSHYTKLGRIASLPDMKLYTHSADNESETLSMKKPPEVSQIDDNVIVEDECSCLIPDVSSYNGPSLHTGEEVIHDEQADVTRHPLETDEGVEVSTTRENFDENEMADSPEHELFELPAALGQLPLEHEHSRGRSLFDIPQDYTASADMDVNFGYLEEQDTTAIDRDLGYIVEQEISTKALEDLMDVQIHLKDREFFNYVRYVLEVSGLSGKEHGSLTLNNQPLDLAVYNEVEDIWMHDPSSIKNEEGSGNNDHMLLFDLINEVLLDIYERSFTYYPKTLSPHCRIHRMPSGHRVLEEVWTAISRYMSFEAGLDQTMDYATCKDLEKQDNWLHLQHDSEGIGIELEDLIFDELLEEMIFE